MPIETDQNDERGHESVNHQDPSSAGLMKPMDPAVDEVPGTGIMGDETLVRDADGEGLPGISPGSNTHTGGEAHPGPASDRKN